MESGLDGIYSVEKVVLVLRLFAFGEGMEEDGFNSGGKIK